MKPLGIMLHPLDPLRIGNETIEELKRLLPFEEARFLPCPQGQDLISILDHIPMSARQRERAEKKIRLKTGFWDRVAQKAVVPLVTGQDGNCLGLFEFSAIPKDVSPQEAERTLGLMKTLLGDRLYLSKLSRTLSQGDAPPRYLADLANTCDGTGCDIIQLSFHKRVPDIHEAKAVIRRVFSKGEIEFCGRSCSTLWYALHDGGPIEFSDGIRQLALLFPKMRLSYRAILGHTIQKDHGHILDFQHLAKGLASAVLMPSALEEIRQKTNADLRSTIFRPKGLRLTALSCCVMVSLESISAAKRLKETLNDNDLRCQVFEAGARCLLLLFKRPDLGQGQSLHSWAQALSKKLSNGASTSITVGVACASQSSVSRKFTPFYALLALLHAHLLGKGKMAIFDHVTHNVHGDLLLSWGDIRGACKAYRKGLKINPSDTNLLNSLGVCLADLRRIKEAKSCFHKVLESEPDNFMALYNLSGINLDCGKLKEAEKQAHKAHEMDPHNPAVLLRLANCWIKQNRFQELMELLWPEIEKSQTPALSLLRICGQAALETGRWHEAKKLLTRCLNKKRNDPLCLAFLAKGYMHYENDMDTAARLLNELPQKALESKPVREICLELKKTRQHHGQV